MSGALTVGDIFEGRYQISGILGRGGFSVVYDATDLDYRRRVALKLVSTEGERYSGPTRARFEREIAAVADLDSPHSVKVFEYGSTIDGDLYAVFEYIPGRDLAEVLKEQERLEPHVVEHILRQLLAALANAHRAGILHRDLKPENVRVFEHDGDLWHVKLLDFGIARPEGALASSVTATGELIGTPKYMSPEQLTDTQLTAASDIYSLGVLAYELVVGRDALGGNAWSDQLHRLQSGEHFSVAAIQDAERLHAVIAKMTAFELSDRFASADEVLRALREPDTVEDHPAVTKPLRPAPRARESTTLERATTLERQAPNRRALTILVTASLVVVIGLAVVAVRKSSTTKKVPQLPAELLAPAAPAPSTAAPSRSAPAKVSEGEPPTPVTDIPGAVPTGCGKPVPFVGRGRMMFERDLYRNPWHSYIPAGYDGETAAPLVVFLHDRLQDPARLLTGSGLQELAEKHGFVIAAPVDTSVLAWTDDSDQQLVEDIVEETAAQLCIDRRRIYLVAQGNAGETAVPLACRPWVTALATNSYRRGYARFACDRPVPMLMLSPLRSSHERVKGGTNCKGTRQLSLADAEELWRGRNSCSSDSLVVFQHGQSTCRRWTCDVPFESCHIDGGRNWPGGPPRSSDLNCEGPEHRFPTAEHVWRFFTSVGSG